MKFILIWIFVIFICVGNIFAQDIIEPAILVPTNNPHISGNNLLAPTILEGISSAHTQQELKSGGWVEGTLIAGPISSTAWIGLLDASQKRLYSTFAEGYSIKIVFNRGVEGFSIGLSVYEDGIRKYHDPSARFLNFIRIRILISGIKIQCFRDGLLFYESQIIPTLPVVGIADTVYPESKVENILIGEISSLAINPLEVNEFFIRQQYRDLLRREGDEGGLIFWSSILDACNGNHECLKRQRLAIVCAFITSEEYQARFGNITFLSDCRFNKGNE